jgi:hypothetical protein
VDDGNVGKEPFAVRFLCPQVSLMVAAHLVCNGEKLKWELV